MDDSLMQAIQQMKNGEEKGFNAVYSATYKKVYTLAQKLTRTEDDARDVTQIVYVEAYRSIHTLKAPEAFISWLYGITHNQAMKVNDKLKPEKEYLVGEDALGILEEQESLDASTMPELTADQKATSEIVRGIIEELPVLQKEAVIAYYYEGLKVEEIAEAIGCPVNTVKSRLNYARKYIRERVEEKEEKEGYRLHVLGLPILWYAISSMEKDTRLTVQAAQQIYNGACSEVGLQATAISVTADAAGTTTAAAAAGETAATGAGEAMGTGAAIAGAAAATAGAGAGMASLGIAAKALIVAGAVAVAGLGTAGIVKLTNRPVEEEVQESTEIVETLADMTTEETVAQETEETIPEETLPGEIELSEAAARQISAFVAAAYQCNYSSVNQENGWKTFSMTPDECLMFVKEYIDMVNYSWGGGDHNAADLPYDWINYNVTEQEVADFCKSGLGIEIPADYSYSFSNDAGSLQIVDGRLESTFDGRDIQVAGGTAELVSQEEQNVVISGTCYWYDPEETAYQFTVTGVTSGNSDIFGGLTIQNIEITEDSAETTQAYDYRVMAQKAAELMSSLQAQGVFAEDNTYSINDIDKDGVPEVILCRGTCNADYEYVIYSFDGTDLTEKATTPWGDVLYGYFDQQAMAIRYVQMGYELVHYYDSNTNETTLISEKELTETAGGDYIGGYEFPMSAYRMTAYTARDEDSLYKNIMFVAQ